jgi:hypothetical protein
VDPSVKSQRAAHDGRARRASRRQAPARRAPDRHVHPERRPAAADRDRGTTLLFTFVAALLTMVGLICLVAIIDATWFLIVAMALDLVITAGVLAMLFRLAGDEDGS